MAWSFAACICDLKVAKHLIRLGQMQLQALHKMCQQDMAAEARHETEILCLQLLGTDIWSRAFDMVESSQSKHS